MFYDPKAYGILPHRHCYTQTGEESLTAYFVPCTKIPKNRARFLTQRGFVDEDKVKAWQQEVRANMINTPDALMDHCAEFPFTDAEAFSAGNINKFNKILITEQLTRIRALKQCPKIDQGYLKYNYREGKHTPDNIIGINWVDNHAGKIKILEHPLWTLQPKKDEETGEVIWNPPNDIVKNLYVMGVDGIDIGASQTSEYTKTPSDFCCVIYKRVYGNNSPQIVALYKDRPNDAREAYKTAFGLAMYYNAQINIEATRMSFFSWAKEFRQVKWFMRRPRATLSEQFRNTNKQYGTPATAAIIAHQTDLIADFVNDYCSNIWFDEVLDELNNYTDENKRKFDIIASLGMAMLADEELQGTVPKTKEVSSETHSQIGYYTDENGYRRWGVIPNKSPLQILTNNNFGQHDYQGIRTSDPRLINGYL